MINRIKTFIITLVVACLIVSSTGVENVSAAVKFQYNSVFEVTGNGAAYLNLGPKMEFYRSDGMKSFNGKCVIENKKTYKFSSLTNRGIIPVAEADSYFDGFLNDKGQKLSLPVISIDILKINYKGFYIYDYYPSAENADFSHITKQMYASMVSEYVESLYGTRRFSVAGQDYMYKLPKKDQSIRIVFRKKSLPDFGCPDTITKVYGDKIFKIARTIPDGLAVRYSSSSSRVASVDKSSGSVRINGEGVARLTIKSSENNCYLAGTKYVQLKVYPAPLKKIKGKYSGNNSIELSWSTDEKCSGYNIEFSDTASFSRIILKKNISSAGTGTSVVKPAKADYKKCKYVRIRPFKKSCGYILNGNYTKCKIK